MSKLIFLLGAGASRDAGLPLMPELTTGFRPWLEQASPSGVEGLLTLFDAAVATVTLKGPPNIESILSLLGSLKLFKDGRYADAVAAWKAPFDADAAAVDALAAQIRKFIVERLREGKAASAAYLAGVFDFIGGEGGDAPLDVFTLNYDRLLEATAMRAEVRFTTGFGDKWDPRLFSEGAWDMRVFKLHGSLDWYFLPARRVIYQGAKEHFAYPNEGGTEALLYPASGKATHADPYATLMSFFTTSLAKAEFCVAIGYSFNDSDIRRRVLDHLSTNRRLQLLIVNPTAKEIVSSLEADVLEPSFSDFDQRVITLRFDARTALNDRLIRHRLAEVRLVDNAAEAVRSYRNSGDFVSAASTLLGLLERSRALAMPAKAANLLADVSEGEYRAAMLAALRETVDGVTLSLNKAVVFKSAMQRLIPEFGTSRPERFAQLVSLWLLADVLRADAEREVVDAAIADTMRQAVLGLALLDGHEFVAWKDVLDPGGFDALMQSKTADLVGFGRALSETPPTALLRRSSAATQGRFSILERGAVAFGNYLSYLSNGGARRHRFESVSVIVPDWHSWRITVQRPTDLGDPLVGLFGAIQDSRIVSEWVPTDLRGPAATLAPS